MNDSYSNDDEESIPEDKRPHVYVVSDHFEVTGEGIHASYNTDLF